MQKKRILAALLSAAMVVTSAAVPVLADELDEAAPEEVETVEAVEAPEEIADDAIELAEEQIVELAADSFYYLKPQWCKEHFGQEIVLPDKLNGSGSKNDPYTITGDADMAFFRKVINEKTEPYYNTEDEEPVYFQLQADVELVAEFGSGSDSKKGASASIGAYSEDGVPDQHPFCGVLTGAVKNDTPDAEAKKAKDGKEYYTITLINNAVQSNGKLLHYVGIFKDGLFYENRGVIENIGIAGKQHISTSNKKEADGNIFPGECVPGGYETDPISVNNIITRCNYGTVSNCVLMANVEKGPITGDANRGMAGDNYGLIEDCINYGNWNIVVNGSGPTSNDTNGSIVGTSYGVVRNCENNGNVSANQVGGIVGFVAQAMTMGAPTPGMGIPVIEDCVNNGEVKSTIASGGKTSYAGGIVGSRKSNSIVRACTNNGAVSCTVNDGHAGGIIGELSCPSLEENQYVSNCLNTGNISATGGGGSAGGIMGGLSGGNATASNKRTVSGAYLSNCVNTGNVTGSGASRNAGGNSERNPGVGGICGQCGAGEIINCYSSGSVTSSETDSTKLSQANVGGILGELIDQEKESALQYNYYYSDDETLMGIGGLGSSNHVGEDSTNHAERLTEKLNEDEYKNEFLTPAEAKELWLSLENSDGDNTADIVLTAIGNVYRYMAAELTFTMTPSAGGDASDNYKVSVADGAVLTDLGDGKYGFNLEEGPGLIGDRVVIGTVELMDYGTYNLEVTKGVVQTALGGEVDDNIVKTWESVAADSAETKNKLVLKTPKATLSKEPESIGRWSIYVYFPNDVENRGQNEEYMTVTLDGLMLKHPAEFKLGNVTGDENTTVETVYGTPKTLKSSWTKASGGHPAFALVRSQGACPLPCGMYTLTVEGEGYRTYRTSFVLDKNNTRVELWNNVKDESACILSTGNIFTDWQSYGGTAVPVEEERYMEKSTFLAGDIDDNQKIDLYDLSADVAYFGAKDIGTNYSKYAKYDLNRDGRIDSKDIAMVLVSWGN